MPEPPTPPGSESTASEMTEREELLSILAENIRGIDAHLETFDPEDVVDEELQIKWLRALGYLVGQYRKLSKDTDIDEMEERLEFIQALEEDES